MIAESHLLATLPAVSAGVFHPACQPGRVEAPAGDEGFGVADRLGLGDHPTQWIIGPVRAAGAVIHGDTLAELTNELFLENIQSLVYN